MERSIDELLNDEPEVVTEEVATEEPEQAPEPEAPAEGQPRGPDGKFAPKQTGVDEEPQAEPVEPDAGPPPADHLPRDVYEPLKAVRNENRELKERLAAMERQFQQQPQQPPEMPPAFWDDPDKAIEARVAQAAEMAIQRYQQQQTMERINASEAAAKGRHADYEDAFRAFQQAAQANPTLIQQMTSESDPAEFAYKTGRRAMDLEQVGSLDALIAAERAKWEAEAKAAIPAPAQSFPATTATDGSVGSRSGPAWAGPAPISDLLR